MKKVKDLISDYETITAGTRRGEFRASHLLEVYDSALISGRVDVCRAINTALKAGYAAGYNARKAARYGKSKK